MYIKIMNWYYLVSLIFLCFSNTFATDYQIPDTIWNKDILHTGKRPDCPFSKATPVQNYLWGTLDQCKTKCIHD